MDWDRGADSGAKSIAGSMGLSDRSGSHRSAALPAQALTDQEATVGGAFSLARKAALCWMHPLRSINGVASFERMKLRTCDRAVVLPRLDVDEPWMINT